VGVYLLNHRVERPPRPTYPVDIITSFMTIPAHCVCTTARDARIVQFIKQLIFYLDVSYCSVLTALKFLLFIYCC